MAGTRRVWTDSRIQALSEAFWESIEYDTCDVDIVIISSEALPFLSLIWKAFGLVGAS